jgi:CheY-like chemotaxis protein
VSLIEQRPLSLVRPTRPQTEMLLDQVQAIDAWTRQHRIIDLRFDDATSRQDRLDIARRKDVLQRQHQALVDWTQRQLSQSDRPLSARAEPRAVLVHRNEWVKSKLTGGLQEGGVTVVAALENGADAVGVVIAEQPDLLLVEDKLPMVTGLDVTREARRYAPSTVVVAQVANDWEIGPFLEAGATTAFSRRVPPADIVAEVLAFLAA